jgi:16S rRNA (uracil1498-N3)-methyltransferase
MNSALRGSAAHVFVESLEHPVLDGDDVHHLVRVLRLRQSEVVSASNGAGQWRLCRLGTDGELAVEGEIVDEPVRTPPITVGFALPKGDRPEWIVQKLTEIGVDRIILLHTTHSVVRWDDSRASRNLVRLAKVSREAAMQSRRVRLVDIVGPVGVGEICDSRATGTAIAEPGGGEPGLGAPTILIGPEGGWTASELALCSSTVSLGPTILRVETAALVAATQLVMLREQAAIGRQQ